MSVSTVTMVRPCPACGVELTWYGTCAEPGGSTAWVINCWPCGLLPSSSSLEGEPRK